MILIRSVHGLLVFACVKEHQGEFRNKQVDKRNGGGV